MFKRFKTWLKRREQYYDLQEKGRLCAPCINPCGEDLCKKIGCLNMDMRTNSIRLHRLVQRLEDTGYIFLIEEPKTVDNVVNLDDFRFRKI